MGTPGTKTVCVVNPDEQEATLVEGFTHTHGPTAADVTPNVAPLADSTQIIITGTSFLSGPDVIVGRIRAPQHRRVSPTQIIATTPPSGAGPQNVMVRNLDGQ